MEILKVTQTFPEKDQNTPEITQKTAVGSPVPVHLSLRKCPINLEPLH